MKPITTWLILTLFAVVSYPVSASLEARQVPTAKYILTGYSSTLPYPYYNISVPEDGVTTPITNPLIVYSISPASVFTSPFTPTSNCTFTLEDGTLAYVDSTYDIIPQKVVSVSCVPISSAPSASSTATGYSPTISSSAPFVYPATTAPLVVSSSTLPLFYNRTGSRPTVGGTGAHGSALPSTTTGPGLTPGGGGVLAFKGGAGRVVVGFQGLIVTMIGVGLVL